MAQVDFSNAVLDVYEGSSSILPATPMAQNNYLKLLGGINSISGSSAVTTGDSVSVITNTPSKVSILHTGTFAESGTAFLIGQYWDNSNWRAPWKVSNISFSAGDSYSFIIDIETSGNT